MKTESPGKSKEKAAAAALLLLAKRGSKRMVEAASSGLDEAVAEIARQSAKEHFRKASIVGGILFASQAMAEKLRDAAQQSRLDARQGARKRLAVELGKMGIDAKESLQHGATGRSLEDAPKSRTAADLISAAWRASATVAASKAFRRGEDPVRAVEATRERLKRNAELAGRSEVADAYGAERTESLGEAAAADRDFAEMLSEKKLVRVWVSVLETRTCSPCARHHGDTTPWGSDFDGDEPGDMHPRCLCTDYLTTE